MNYTVVIPCYRSSETVKKVIQLLNTEMKSQDLEIILVNDGSPDNGETASAIFALADENKNVIAIDLAKNTGQHNATLCGFNYASGDVVVVMDDDLQTHPSQINKLLNKLDEGYDVVYANYPEKKHKWYRNLGSRFNSWTISKLIGKPKGLKTSSFWVCRKFVRDNVIQYKNANVFMPGLVLRTTTNIATVNVEHFERAFGQSGYNMKALIKLWSNVIGFSVKPLRCASVCGFAFAVLGFIGAIVIFIRKFYLNVNTIGWSSLMVANCFFSGIILMFMGLIGEYIGRMFLDSGNQPQFVIKKIKGQNDEKD